ncbi:MAG: efflux RND transporter permease subunit [Armatimonadetes bacterium]|nr:efflux RND transporter permease subunit [Armatimonadota bacterium]
MWLTNVAVRRRVTMLMIVGALMVLGYTRLREMPLEYFPQVDFPIVTVFTAYPGAGPDEIEQKVTKPIEDTVAILNGVDELTSQSQDSLSVVIVQFKLEVNADVAAADVRDAVAQAKATFPDDVKDPVVRKLDINAIPIVSIGVTGSRSPKNMLTFVEDYVKPRLGQVSGVSAVNVSGGEVREIQVEARKERLEAVGLSINQLANLVAAENLDIPAGELKEGARSFAVRAIGQFKSLDEIRRLRIPTPRGGIVYLSDLADVQDAAADASTISRLNGQSTVAVDVLKQTGANTVDVSDGVRAAIKELDQTLPQDIEFTIYQDSADDTREAVKDVRDSLLLGALLASLVTFIFLHNLRAMVIVALAIPTSIICTFLPIYFFGFTLNMLTMLALSLSVGILVDDSIVVIENIERHFRIGEEPAVAAVNGRAEIGGAAVAITLVDVVVFVPVAFMKGMIGRFFFAFGITAACATLLSLFMSFTLTPMLASWWFKRETAAERDRAAGHWTRPIWAAMDAPFNFLERTYRRFLPPTLRHPYLAVVLGYMGLITITMAAMKSGRVPFEFFPASQTGQIQVLLETAPGTRLEVMDALTRQVEERVLDKARYPEVKDVSSTAGSQGSSFMGAGNTGGQYGVVNVKLARKTERRERGQRTDGQFEEDLRRDLAGLPSVEVKVVRAQEHGGGGAPVAILMQSPDPTALDRASAELARGLSEVPGLLYPDVSAKRGRPELRVRIDRARSADLGFTAAQVAMALRAAYEGDTSSQFREGGDEYDLRVRLSEFDRTRVEDVEGLFVGLSPTGQTVRLGDLAQVYMDTGPSRIERQDRQRSVTVESYLEEGVAEGEGQVLAGKVLQEMQAQGRLAGVNWRWTGTTQRRGEEFGYMFQAIALAIVLVYMVTAALYTNILQPLNVMLTIPMAFGGGILALAIMGQSISISSLIGTIMLMGIVGKNAILVVDYTNTLKARGKSTYEALLEAGPTRMRPIFMTTIACIMGLLPTALALNEGSEFRQPMATVVIGGLILSTVLTLLIVPSFYVITDTIQSVYYRIGARLMGGRGKGTGTE